MNARLIVCSLAFALLAAPAAALACGDGGPPNRACNDGGAQWIGCTDHAQCPEGQYCTGGATCGCGSREASPASVCDDSGCHGCFTWSPGSTCSRPPFVCPDPTGTDASVDAGGGGTVDVGGGGGGGDGCTVRAPGDRAAGSPVAVLAALVGIAALARVRRR